MPDLEKGLIKVPPYVQTWFQKIGVSKLEEFLKPQFVVSLGITPDWALGKIRVITLPTMAGDGLESFVPGTGKRWKLLYLYLKIVADANAANRYFRLTIKKDLSTVLFGIGGNQTAITAGQTKVVQIGQMDLDDVWFWDDGTAQMVATSRADNLIFRDDFYLTVSVSGGLPGDVVTGQIVVIEMDDYGGS